MINDLISCFVLHFEHFYSKENWAAAAVTCVPAQINCSRKNRRLHLVLYDLIHVALSHIAAPRLPQVVVKEGKRDTEAGCALKCCCSTQTWFRTLFLVSLIPCWISVQLKSMCKLHQSCSRFPSPTLLH